VGSSSSLRRFDLVIFDCDGVLVDSERLAVRVEAEILASLGWPLSRSEIVHRFVGRSAAYMHGEIERHLGRPIDWDAEFEARYRQAFERDLLPVDGIIDALDSIKVPYCVASSGSHDKIRFSLGLTGLWERFEGKVFSAQDVTHGKPAPDLFLHAAACMGAEPRRCAVVEDSEAGVVAGVAAAMQVFAYAGSVTEETALARQDVVTFRDMRMLGALLH